VAAAVIMDEASGALLYEVNPHLRLPPASLTKIATAVVSLELLDTSHIVETMPNPDREWLDDATVMGLQPGDHFSVKELLYGMMLKSGNDAAKELARAAAGSESAFVLRMNELAHRLGLGNTRFSDVHGLGGVEHYSSAYDLAVLARHAMTLPEFREVVGTESRTTTDGSRPIDLYNHNPLLNYTPGVTGVKTGFTEQAGNTFVVSVERDGHGIILVMLNAPNRAFDAIDLIEWAYANHTWP
jgi:D-alanyl-D-alanine carboxypeptidase (penicillin-binding protein 5/6)